MDTVTTAPEVGFPLTPAAESLALTHESDLSSDTQLDGVLRTLSTWHDENHDGPWRFCEQQPCDAVRKQTTPPPTTGKQWENR